MPKPAEPVRCNWEPPDSWVRVATIDLHTGGEPLRVLVGGLPPIQGRTVLEKRRYFRDHYDHIRTGVLWEPRGHADMYGAVMTAAEDADFDVFFLHNEGYSTMCGHAIIALTTLAVEADLLGVRARARAGHALELSFNVPAGRVSARAEIRAGRADAVSFRNVPSFVSLRDGEVDVPGIGRVRFDIAYGGAFYALVEAGPLGLALTSAHFNRLIDCGRRIKQAVSERFPVAHPFEADLSFLYGVIFTGPPEAAGHHSRNVCIFAEGELDRSATGSGVSARAALHFARGELPLHQPITIESILGSTMTVRAVEQTSFGPYPAVVPQIGGTAFLTGRSEFCFDPQDPFRRGFVFR